MEIGSFIELEFNNNNEYYLGDDYCGMDIARLNSGRAAIYHAVRCYEGKTVYLPYYQCESVRNFLIKKGIQVKYYYLNNKFEPLINKVESDSVIVIVNYFGIFDSERMQNIANLYKKVIVDNSQAFFAKPLKACVNIYSPRKFIGVPDGAYVIGYNVLKFIEEYKQGYSSDTALFMLLRIEYGCEGKAYKNRIENEMRIDNEDVLKMSKLTHTILDGTNYNAIKEKRCRNFELAHELLGNYNNFDTTIFCDREVVPMVYPFMHDNKELLSTLLSRKHFQGNWWVHVANEVDFDRFEAILSRNLIPITIDQRYSEGELKYIAKVIKEVIKR